MTYGPGDAIGLTAWIAMVAMTIVVLMKLSSKFITIRRLQSDDVVIFGASVLAIGQTIAVTQAVRNGFGSGIAPLSPDQADSAEKASLASQILYVAAICCAEASFALFLKELSATPFYITCGRVLLAFIGARAFASIFAVAFQCPAPNTWSLNAQGCSNRAVFWDIFAALDVFTNLLTVSLSTYVVWRLHMPRSARLIVTAALAAKLLTIPTTILRPVWLSQAFSNPNDASAVIDAQIVTQIDMNVNIIATCIPFLKAVTERMEHSWFSQSLRVSTIASDSRNGISDQTSTRGSSRRHLAGGPAPFGSVAESDARHMPRTSFTVESDPRPRPGSKGARPNVPQELDCMVIHKDVRFWTEAQHV